MAGERDTPVLIVGGGIAGLTAAIALRHYGIESLLFEQADDLRKTQLGSGLALGYNVTRAFSHLGLLDEVAERAAPVKALQFMTEKGKHIGTGDELEGERALGIIRPVFHEFLADTLGHDKVQLGAKLVRFEQDDGGVTAHFADGRTARGGVLLGIDGFHSTVRKQLFGESEPHYCGYVTRRGVVETEAAKEGVMRILLGHGERFLYYPVGRWYMYWTASRNEPAGGQQTGAEAKGTVLERFGDWPEGVAALVEATDESRTFVADTYDRDPIEQWGEGRVTLLGDAAHPMTWDRGQGAGQGIEDAVLLARELSQGDDPVAALRAWEAQRIPRANKIVRSSRQLGKLQQMEKPVPRLGFRLAIKLHTTDFMFKRGNKSLLVDY